MRVACWPAIAYTIGRDAIQVGYAFEVCVEHNPPAGAPFDIVDAEPVAIDTAGNVERSSYALNEFLVVNGKCIDLDGFHDGEVTRNSCRKVSGYGIVMNNTNPDMQSRNIRIVRNWIENLGYGGIFVIGTGHTIAQNRVERVNSGRCDDCIFLPNEPDMLRSGIYLGTGAERPDPARGNVIEDNEITGYKMSERCVKSAPGITGNIVRNNVCRDLP
jgi:hypothetical protein